VVEPFLGEKSKKYQPKAAKCLIMSKHITGFLLKVKSFRNIANIAKTQGGVHQPPPLYYGGGVTLLVHRRVNIPVNGQTNDIVCIAMSLQEKNQKQIYQFYFKHIL